MFPEQGYKLIKSRGINTLLSSENMALLRSLGNNIHKEQCFRVYFPNNDVFAISFLRPTVDRFGRKGSWNHTILIPTDALTTLLHPHFIHNLDAPPISLEPIMIDQGV